MSKLAKQRGQALTPRFVNNGHGTAEITYSTARACHEVPACSRDAVCSSRCGLHRESPGCSARGLHWGDIAILLPGAMLWLCYGSVTGMRAAASALRQPGEQMCLRFLRLCKPPSCIPGWVLPSLASANTVDGANSEATGIMKRTSSAMMQYTKDVFRPMRWLKVVWAHHFVCFQHTVHHSPCL